MAEPGGRAPAPGRLRLVQRFVNTNDVEGGRDRLATPDAAAAWFAEALDADVRLTPVSLGRAVAFREALRALLLEHNGIPAPPEARAELDSAAARARLTATFAEPGADLVATAADPLDRALGTLIAAIVSADERGTFSRLKACRHDACRWAFYDHSKNRSGTWCTMAICGNRVKTRAYAARRRG
jgi:predicted RNA-binding Zn ribbon-like protein